MERQALLVLVLALCCRQEAYLCLAQGHSASRVDVGVQVLVIVPLLGDSFQLGLPALLGRVMVVVGWCWGPRAPSLLLCPVREVTSLWLCFDHLPERRVILGGLREQSQPEFLPTGNSLGNQAMLSYVFCPQSTPS